MSIKVQDFINTKLNSVQDQLNFVAPILPPASKKKKKKITLQSSTYPSKTPTTSIQVDHPLFPQTAQLIHSICQSVIYFHQRPRFIVRHFITPSLLNFHIFLSSIERNYFCDVCVCLFFSLLLFGPNPVLLSWR